MCETRGRVKGSVKGLCYCAAISGNAIIQACPLSLASEADARGRPGYEDKEFPQGDYFRQALALAKDIDIDELRSLGFENLALANDKRSTYK